MNGALVFDLDGTLVDTSGDIAFSANHIRKQQGLSPLTVPEVLASVGHGAHHLIVRIAELKQDNDPRIEPLLHTFTRHYLKHQTERSKLYAGIPSALVSLKKHYDLYILSNKPHKAVMQEAERQGIEPFFKAIWGAGALPAMKPNPVGIATAIEKSGVSTSRAIMIGDMVPDIQVGINAKISTCFVNWGFGTLKKGDPEPTITIDAVEDLEPAISRLLIE